jgi:hypothetical protein
MSQDGALSSELSLGPSRALALLFSGGFLLGLLSLLQLNLPMLLRAALVFALGAQMGWAMGLHALRCVPGAIIALRVLPSGGVQVRFRNRTECDCQVLPDSGVLGPLVVLRLKPVQPNPSRAKAVRAVVLVPDTLEREVFRRLRVWLRWQALQNTDQAA